MEIITEIITRAVRKLRAKGGDSIAEVLIALLVGSAGILVLATMLSSSRKIVMESRELVREYVKAENVLASQSGTSAYTVSGSGTVAIYENNAAGGSSAMVLSDDDHRSSFDVTVQVNTFRKSQPIISYKE